MVKLTKLNDEEIVVNADMIITVEPRVKETIVVLTDGDRFAVKENADQIIAKVVNYRASIRVETERLLRREVDK